MKQGMSPNAGNVGSSLGVMTTVRVNVERWRGDFDGCFNLVNRFI